MKEQKKFGIFKSENNKLTRINAVVIDESISFQLLAGLESLLLYATYVITHQQ
jgi:hypothetical protein